MVGKLTAKGVEGLMTPGRYTDGDGLTMYVDSEGRRYWQLRYRLNAKRRDLSLGAVRTMSLREARDAAHKARALIRDGIDPVATRRKTAASRVSFEQAAERVHAMRVAGWSNGKHQDQWLASLRNHVYPLLGSKPVAELTRADVVGALAPIWLVMPETARRVKQRIEAIIDWAVGEEIRDDGLNFKLVTKALPRQSRRVKHMAALHYLDLPAFMKALAMSPATPSVRVAIELMILSASRPANIRFMTWDEVDLEAAVWRVPAAKMKMKRDHVVPLVPRAVEIVRLMERHRSAGRALVFPGDKPGRPMSENTKCKAIQALGFDATAHGFRSSFKDWSRAAGWEDYLSEFQLAHVDQNKSREPYGRDGQVAQRRAMMTEWSAFVAGVAAAPGYENDTDRGAAGLGNLSPILPVCAADAPDVILETQPRARRRHRV